jgi:hypothetical protein
VLRFGAILLDPGDAVALDRLEVAEGELRSTFQNIHPPVPDQAAGSQRLSFTSCMTGTRAESRASFAQLCRRVPSSIPRRPRFVVGRIGATEARS